VVNRYDENFNQIQEILLKIYSDDTFIKVANNGYLDPYEEKLLINKLKSYTDDNVYISNLFIVTKNSDFILTPNGSYNRKRFFNTIYFNPEFTEDYWNKEISKPFTYNYYPENEFSDRSIVNARESQWLMPIAFKNKENSKFILVALINVRALAHSIENNFMDNLYILKDNENIIYPSTANVEVKKLISENHKNFSKTKTEYIFIQKSESNGFIYLKLLSNTFVTNQLGKTYLIFFIVIVFSLVISLAISIYIVRKFNNPVKSIVDIIKRSGTSYLPENIVDLKSVRDNIEKIVTQNLSFAEDIYSKNSMLKSFLYQSKLKNIYLNVNEIKDQLASDSSYALVYFKIYYRKVFYDEVSADSSKSSFLLKELIQLYLKDYFTNFVIFQPENDQVIIIVNIDKDDIKKDIEEILMKLKQEEYYAFFTVVISKVYSDVSKLNEIYNNMFQIVKYRSLIPDTQLMLEETINLQQGKFYFSLKQAEQLNNAILNGKGDEAVQQVSEVLEYNFKREANSFNTYLLCTEFVSCCVKVLTELYYEIPEILDTSYVYAQINKCITIMECKNLCIDFIKSVTNYINSHKRESDYIIDYVEDYIRNHYVDDIYLDLLSDKLNITKTYLSSYFKNKTGINLSVYINNFRIKKAIEILENTTMKVHDIGTQVGISNTNTFIRLFKKYAGEAPGEYRKRKI
jgi:AraC-like DNA-binding protein